MEGKIHRRNCICNHISQLDLSSGACLVSAGKYETANAFSTKSFSCSLSLSSLQVNNRVHRFFLFLSYKHRSQLQAQIPLLCKGKN